MEDATAKPTAKIQEKPGQVTTHIKNLDGEIIAWDAVREALEVEHISIPMAEERFKIKRKTLYEKVRRMKWKHIKDHVLKSRKKLAENVADKIIKIGPEGVDWPTAGETHRELAFRIAHKSVAKFKPRAPKNFRELEAADKIARRAAGLDVADVIAPTLIQVNELINEAEPQVLEASEVPPAIDATVVEEPPETPKPEGS